MQNTALALIILLLAAAATCAGCGGSSAYPIGITQPGTDITGTYHSAEDVDGLGSLTLTVGPIEGRTRDEVYEASLRSGAGQFTTSAYGTGTVGDNHAAFDFSVGEPGEFYASIQIDQAAGEVTALTAELVFPDQLETLTIVFIPIN